MDLKKRHVLGARVSKSSIMILWEAALPIDISRNTNDIFDVEMIRSKINIFKTPRRGLGVSGLWFIWHKF